MHKPRWCLFYDVHTQPACPDVGAAFDAQAWADRWQRCGVDYVVFHARCNMGLAYYNTTVGLRHPSLTYDLFGQLVDACSERGIAVGAYINAGLSHEEGLRHREWLGVQADGRVYGPNPMDNFMRMMCYNTGYGDHLVEMVREVVGGYPLAGLFLDCFNQHPCIGVECIEEMKELGLDWSDPRTQRDFAELSRQRMARRITEAAQALNPDLLIYYNGLSVEAQAETGTYLEYECLPTGGWGYEVYPLWARFFRTLGKPLLNMTGRFHRSWGDFGGIRSEAGLEYDVVHSLALGLRVTIGDHFHPRGEMNEAVFELIEKVYGRLQPLEPWLEGAKGVAEVALISPPAGFRFTHPEDQGPAQMALQGAARMLCELKQQFDVVGCDTDWSHYQVLVLPDLLELDATAAAKVQAHLANGGAVIATALAGAEPGGQRFALDEWGLDLVGEEPCDPAFFKARPEFAHGLPDMPSVFYRRGVEVGARTGTEVLAEIVAPYYNRHWDGEHHYFYLPPDRPTGRPAVTQCGSVAYVSHPIFTTYLTDAPLPTRQLMANLLNRLLPRPMLRCPDLPSYARATVTAGPSGTVVWLLPYVPERRGLSVDMVEEPITLREVRLELRLDGPPPARAYLAPSREALPLSVADGYAHVTVPKVDGWAAVVFESSA